MKQLLPWFFDKGPGDCHALLLSTGELVRKLLFCPYSDHSLSDTKHATNP